MRFDNWLRQAWQRLLSTLWFVPMLIVIGAIVLAIVLIEVDSTTRGAGLAERWPRLFGASADGARGLLSTIAASMMTVVGVTFSITVVSLSLAATQYTSRVLRNFMRDRTNQAVLGVFVGVFAYSLVVLRTIRGGDTDPYIPAIAVIGALLLVLIAIGFLIYFIHHVAESIQAASIVQAAAEETVAAIDRLFPERLDNRAEGRQPTPPRAREAEPWTAVASTRTGYVQSIDIDALFDLACRRRLVLRLEKAIGEFAIEGLPLLLLAGEKADDALATRLCSAYGLGRDRTVQQDPAYGVRQIVDVALKALSPGINDSTTAINCIDFLGAILARLATRRLDSHALVDDGTLRVIVREPTFEQFLRLAFDEIRQNAERNSAVLVRLLDVLATIGTQTAEPVRVDAVARQIDWALEATKRGLAAPHDRAPIEAAAEHAWQLVKGRSRTSA